jgi:hypothetical protein
VRVPVPGREPWPPDFARIETDAVAMKPTEPVLKQWLFKIPDKDAVATNQRSTLERTHEKACP